METACEIGMRADFLTMCFVLSWGVIGTRFSRGTEDDDADVIDGADELNGMQWV